jgi:uncharacterized iron-regulated membrane protein
MTLQKWLWLHKWSSLVCTLFLLIICVTGLPLVFREEINGWLQNHQYADLPANTPTVSIDRLTKTGHDLFPGQIVSSIFIDDDEPQIYVWMAPSWAAYNADRRSAHFIRFDARTGEVLEQSAPLNQRPPTFINVMLSLHKDLFADLAGELFLGFIALVFIVAIVSGVVLYAPFMRKLDFGTVRTRRAPRLKWLDLHNLLGVVTVAWALVVGATGLMNELSTPLFDLWRRTDVPAMLAPFNGKPPLQESELTPVQGAVATTKAALPGMTIRSITFPGSQFGTPYHYLIWTNGNTPLTARLFNPVLVDARTGELTATVAMPWYLRLLEISRPLHFGDYGGMPLKIIWALLDLVTIGVLGSGLYLWLARRRTPLASALADADTGLAGQSALPEPAE